MGYLPDIRQVRVPSFRPAEGTSGALLVAWVLSSLLAIVLPAARWASERSRYYRYAGQYNAYEQQQRQYEGGNYNYGGGGYNGGGGYSSLCSWWNFSCRAKMNRWQRNNYGDGGGGGGEEQWRMRAMLPGWYFFFGGSVQNDEREREEMGMGRGEGPLKFVYFCTVGMFLLLAVFGYRTMYVGRDRSVVIAALLAFAAFSLLNLLTAVQGAVETDGRFYENSVYGWFGQWSVLLAYTDLWTFLHCLAFAGLLGVLRILAWRARRDADAARDADGMEYRRGDAVAEARKGYSYPHPGMSTRDFDGV